MASVIGAIHDAYCSKICRMRMISTMRAAQKYDWKLVLELFHDFPWWHYSGSLRRRSTSLSTGLNRPISCSILIYGEDRSLLIELAKSRRCRRSKWNRCLTFMSSLAYYDSYRSERLPANRLKGNATISVPILTNASTKSAKFPHRLAGRIVLNRP